MRQDTFSITRGVTDSPGGGSDLRGVAPFIGRPHRLAPARMTCFVVLEIDEDDVGWEYELTYSVSGEHLSPDVDPGLSVTMRTLGENSRITPALSEGRDRGWCPVIFSTDLSDLEDAMYRLRLYASGELVASKLFIVATMPTELPAKRSGD